MVHLHTVENFDDEAIISERSREIVGEEAGTLLWQSERTYTRGDEIGVLRQGRKRTLFQGVRYLRYARRDRKGLLYYENR